MKRYCGNCGAEADSGARFCESCGQEIAAQAYPDEIIRCLHCGAQIERPDRSCPQCGEMARINGEWEEEDDQSSGRGTNNAYHISQSPLLKWAISMGIALVFAIVGGVYLLLNSIFGQ